MKRNVLLIILNCFFIAVFSQSDSVSLKMKPDSTRMFGATLQSLQGRGVVKNSYEFGVKYEEYKVVEKDTFNRTSKENKQIFGVKTETHVAIDNTNSTNQKETENKETDKNK